MKKYVVSVLLTSFSLCAFGQRDLHSTEIPETIPFSTDKNEGLVIISCDEALKPDFKTNWDEPINFLKNSELEGGNRSYYLLFPTEKKYNGRRLYVMVKGFNRLVIPITLQAKETKKFLVVDSDAVIVDCFHQLTREGLNLFQTGKYEEAKRKYEEAQTCPKIKDEDKSYANAQKMLMDTLIVWKNIGNDYFANSDYPKAIEYYLKILERNSTDEFIRNKNHEAQIKQADICKLNFTKAENYFNEKDYENAKPWYEKIRSQSCPNAAEAENKLLIIKNIEDNKKQCAHVLTYEYGKDVPIGLSTGNYKDHKSSGYFTLRLNSAVFETLQTNNDSISLSTKRPELNLSFGWTIPIVKPVWIFFGPGYTGVGRYEYKEDIKTVLNGKEGDVNNGNTQTLKIYNAISPEAGLLGKITFANKVGIALRYTFQYRFSLDNKMQDYIGKMRHIFGIGLCF